MKTDPQTNRPRGDQAPEIERLKSELRREHELYLRALADYDNYRKRAEREQGAAAHSGKREILLALLDVIDDFERALAHVSDAPPPISDGMKALHRRLLGLLEKQGVAPLKSVGEAFDPALHDAVAAFRSEELPPGTVAEEVQRGYRWGEEVLRPARVCVAE